MKQDKPPKTGLNNLVAGIKRPDWICSNVRQNVILVRDASHSMFGEKSEQATKASQELITELALPANKDGFYAAIINFSFVASVAHPLQKATMLDKVKSIRVQAGTNITAGLEKACEVLNKAVKKQEQGCQYLRPVIIIFTDGCHNYGESPDAIADKIKQVADIVSVAFGNDADETLLTILATSPQHFYRCKDGKELRMFLANVGAAISHTLSAKTNATKALGEIQQ